MSAVLGLWGDRETQEAVLRKLESCGIFSLHQLQQAIETPAPPSTIPPPSSSCYYNGYPPLLNQLVCAHSNGRCFKTETMNKMIRYLQTQHLLELYPQQQHRIVVIGWGSLLYNFGQHGSARLDVSGEELRVDAATRSPINISTAAFKYGMQFHLK